MSLDKERKGWIPAYRETIDSFGEGDCLSLGQLRVGDKITLRFGRSNEGRWLADLEMEILDTSKGIKVLAVGGPGEWEEPKECQIIGTQLFFSSGSIVVGQVRKGGKLVIEFCDQELAEKRRLDVVPLIITVEGELLMYSGFVELMGREAVEKQLKHWIETTTLTLPAVLGWEVETKKGLWVDWPGMGSK